MENEKQLIKERFYKRVYIYSIRIIEFIRKLPKDNVGRVIGDQLLRSGTSIAANLIEAKAASSKKDYINFYSHALKSANESKLWLSLLRDTVKIADNDVNKLLTETYEIANILGASILTMKNKRKV